MKKKIVFYTVRITHVILTTSGAGSKNNNFKIYFPPVMIFSAQYQFDRDKWDKYKLENVWKIVQVCKLNNNFIEICSLISERTLKWQTYYDHEL